MAKKKKDCQECLYDKRCCIQIESIEEGIEVKYCSNYKRREDVKDNP